MRFERTPLVDRRNRDFNNPPRTFENNLSNIRRPINRENINNTPKPVPVINRQRRFNPSPVQNVRPVEIVQNQRQITPSIAPVINNQRNFSRNSVERVDNNFAANPEPIVNNLNDNSRNDVFRDPETGETEEERLAREDAQELIRLQKEREARGMTMQPQEVVRMDDQEPEEEEIEEPVIRNNILDERERFKAFAAEQRRKQEELNKERERIKNEELENERLKEEEMRRIAQEQEEEKRRIAQEQEEEKRRIAQEQEEKDRLAREELMNKMRIERDCLLYTSPSPRD